MPESALRSHASPGPIFVSSSRFWATASITTRISTLNPLPLHGIPPPTPSLSPFWVFWEPPATLRIPLGPSGAFDTVLQSGLLLLFVVVVVAPQGLHFGLIVLRHTASLFCRHFFRQYCYGAIVW